MQNIIVILFSVLLNASAQLLLKKGMHGMSMSGGVVRLASNVFLNKFVLLGLASYSISILVWLYVLSKNQVSFAYPFLSVGYVVVAIAGWLIFDDNLSITRIVGIFLISCGVIFVSRS